MSNDSRIIQFNQFRQSKIEDRRRKYERVLFRNMISVYWAPEAEELRAVDVVDVSEQGLSFQIPTQYKYVDQFKVESECVFRFYFSQDSYMSICVYIINKKDCIENGQHWIRFGCKIDQSAQSYRAYQSFVHFLAKYAEVCSQDSGHKKISYF